MHFTRYAAGAFAAATLLGASNAHAQTAATPAPTSTPAQNNEDITALRHDMQSLRQEYEARIADLEARLARAEAAEGVAPTTPAGTPAPSDQTGASTASADQSAPTDQSAPINTASNDAYSPPPPSAAAGPTSQNIYNPGIAAVLNGMFTAAQNDTGEGERISGFSAGGDIAHPVRGFSLGESEVSFSANIDPFLAGFLDFSIDNQNQISLEEAYIRTTGLPGGLTLKAGRFLSGIGYLNERHAHDWNFSDAPLPYRAFLNNQMGDDGVQIRWIAPTDQFLEFGAEAFRGESYPASGGANDGAGAYTAFVHTGADFNDSSSYLAGLSYLHTRAVDRTDADGGVFNGSTDLGIATFVYKWAPHGNPLVNNLVVAAEFFYGRDSGAFNGIDFDQAHTGWYLQGVYQFMPQWSIGARVSGLQSDDPGLLLAGTDLNDFGHDPLDLTALVEYDTSEFGRLRLQYSHDEATPETNDILTLQYTVIYGPHGAHRY